MFRKAIRSILRFVDEVKLVHEADNGIEALKMLEANTYDVVLLDINMPEMDGIECFKIIKDKWPQLKTIILTQHSESMFQTVFEDLGASGYLLKSTTEDEFIHAFQNIMKQPATEEVSQDDIELSKREKEVLGLVCLGFSSSEIADQLSLSLHTVKNHRKSIGQKLETTSRKEQIKWAQSNGLNF